MKALLLVFVGGGVGSSLRYLISKSLNTDLAWIPYGTFLVNILGSLLIGIILGLVLRSSTLSEATILLLAVGFCGGFTTFSAFAFENYEMLKNGQLLQLLLYTGGSFIVGIGAVALGIWIVRLF